MRSTPAKTTLNARDLIRFIAVPGCLYTNTELTFIYLRHGNSKIHIKHGAPQQPDHFDCIYPLHFTLAHAQ